MPDAFRSQSLVYRAIEDNDEDIEFLHSLNLNSEARVFGDKSLFKPADKKYAQMQAEFLRKDFFSVMICLPISSENTSDAASKTLKPIGRVHLWAIEERHRHHRNTNIGISIASGYQGKGYGSEAIKWILNWAFQMAGLHRVGIGGFSYNQGALKLYERLGFVCEGREREAVCYDGGWHDHVFFGMLEGEWRLRNEKEKSESGDGGLGAP
jgi:RimJ/RimL family protein N-acetyltransferase